MLQPPLGGGTNHLPQAMDGGATFYADGHVRVYHGKLTDLPRRYIARERLCLRGTTDYRVNAMDGRPFFVVSCAVDPGLLSEEQVRIELGERGVRLSNDLWVREVRHLSEKGHQSSILSTDHRSDLSRVAVAMFAR